VKTGGDFIKKCLVLSILVTYVFMLSTYILFLPKYTQSPGASISSSFSQIQRNTGSGGLFVQIHCAFKSVTENKRKSINVLVKGGALACLLIFSGFTLPGLIKKLAKAPNFFLYAHPHYYLSFHTLRI
jgi:hypothetical protein